jgi:hypothetical protein
VPTTDCISPIELQFQRRPLVVTCDAPEVSSDGGALLLRQLDERFGITKRFASLLEDRRDPAKLRHDRLEQLRQRVFQICLGYEDCNDADRLRHDPVWQLASGSPQQALSSQPTLCRFENGVSGRELNRLWRRFEQDYVDALDPASECVVLDIDGTDDPTHGAQQLSFFHGFYDHHMFHPVLVFDGDSGELVTAMLRPGKVHAARGAATILDRLIRAIKRRCPDAAVVVRGDSAFAMPRLMARRGSTRSPTSSATSTTSWGSPRIPACSRSQHRCSPRLLRNTPPPGASFDDSPGCRTPPKPGHANDLSCSKSSTASAARTRASSSRRSMASTPGLSTIAHSALEDRARTSSRTSKTRCLPTGFRAIASSPTHSACSFTPSPIG